MSYNPYSTEANTRRKVFVSFHHADQYYRDKWDELFGHLFINKSVGVGEINDSNSTDYIAQVIRQDYIADASVCVVLIGPNTHCRKHVDWEIAAALDRRTGGARAGLVGLYLPNHAGYYGGSATIPWRLHDNFASGYTKLYNWAEDPRVISGIVEETFSRRSSHGNLSNNSRIQFTRNTC